MKKTIVSILSLLISSPAFAVAGFGISGTQGMFRVDPMTTPLLIDQASGDEQLNVGSFTNHGFENGYGLGFYAYVDALPFVGIDLEGNFVSTKYDFSFENSGNTLDSVEFIWAAFSGYGTIQKDIVKLGVPFLAKAKLFAGAGANYHSSTPLASQNMIESLVTDGDLENGTLSEKDLLNYLTENKIDSIGFHAQTGLQFKLLALDSFVFYRHVFAEDVIPGARHFGSINLRLGLGL